MFVVGLGDVRSAAKVKSLAKWGLGGRPPRTPTVWAGWRAEVEAKGDESPLERGSK